VFVLGKQASIELVDCVIRKNGGNGVVASKGKVSLRGGTFS